jgi:hypothetical protein|tara:strand:- start:209 stop:568 length:360 start_codon:yes stop_codon:yes gene_type:complete
MMKNIDELKVFTNSALDGNTRDKFFCALIADVKNILGEKTNEVIGEVSSMDIPLSDCFCGKRGGSDPLSYDARMNQRTGIVLFEFIREAIEIASADKDWLKAFVLSNWGYCLEENEDED